MYGMIYNIRKESKIYQVKPNRFNLRFKIIVILLHCPNSYIIYYTILSYIKTEIVRLEAYRHSGLHDKYVTHDDKGPNLPNANCQ